VKRWGSGELALRWDAAGMLATEGQFRRVKGCQELPQLALVLKRATAEEPGLPAAVGTAQARAASAPAIRTDGRPPAARDRDVANHQQWPP